MYLLIFKYCEEGSTTSCSSLHFASLISFASFSSFVTLCTSSSCDDYSKVFDFGFPNCCVIAFSLLDVVFVLSSNCNFAKSCVSFKFVIAVNSFFLILSFCLVWSFLMLLFFLGNSGDGDLLLDD